MILFFYFSDMKYTSFKFLCIIPEWSSVPFLFSCCLPCHHNFAWISWIDLLMMVGSQGWLLLASGSVLLAAWSGSRLCLIFHSVILTGLLCCSVEFISRRGCCFLNCFWREEGVASGCYLFQYCSSSDDSIANSFAILVPCPFLHLLELPGSGPGSTQFQERIQFVLCRCWLAASQIDPRIIHCYGWVTLCVADTYLDGVGCGALLLDWWYITSCGSLGHYLGDACLMFADCSSMWKCDFAHEQNLFGLGSIQYLLSPLEYHCSEVAVLRHRSQNLVVDAYCLVRCSVLQSCMVHLGIAVSLLELSRQPFSMESQSTRKLESTALDTDLQRYSTASVGLQFSDWFLDFGLAWCAVASVSSIHNSSCFVRCLSDIFRSSYRRFHCSVTPWVLLVALNETKSMLLIVCVGWRSIR